MSRFDRYVLSQLLVLFGFFSLIFVGVYWINKAVQAFDQLIADGQSAGAVLAFTTLTLPGVIAIAVPIATFAASVYVTNRLNSESELVVVQSTGFSPFRLAVPYLVFGLFTAALTAVLYNILVPAAGIEAREQRAMLANNVTARFLTAGEFLQPADGITFYISELSEDGVLKGVFLSDTRKPDIQTTYNAREAFLVSHETGPKMVMIDGIAQILTVQGKRLSITRFDDFAYDIGRLIKAVRPPTPSLRDLPTLELLRADASKIETLNSTRANFLWEAHNRIAQPLLTIVAAMTGFATLLLGAFSRFGVWRQVLGAIVILIVIKIFDNAASASARGSEFGWPLQYVSIVAGLALSWAMLTYAARTRRPPPLGGEEVAA